MVGELTVHAATCSTLHEHIKKSNGGIFLEGEIKKDGLVSIFRARCSGCEKFFYFESDFKVRDANGHKRYALNLSAVWGSMATGGGGTKLEELLCTMGIPSMSKKTFSRIEEQVGDWWNKKLTEEMVQAAAEERQLALQNGETHEGVPAITVIVDGGWSSRSHKHSYNALGGVAIIIGNRTKKLLHLGVRVKYCSICSRAESMKVPAKKHLCFKNWYESSRAMESDIILEGFNMAESRYGLRYTKMIGDGDSSVLDNLMKNGPHWCRDIQKIECANHCCKCIRSSLENLVKEKPEFKGKHGLTKAKRVKLVSAIRYCIKMRSNEVKTGKTKYEIVRDLQNDIRVMPRHIFGYHDKCASSFCKNGRNSTEISNDMESGESHCQNVTGLGDEIVISDALHQNFEFWNEGMSVQDEENSRQKLPPVPLNNELMIELNIIMNRYVAKASRLLGNFTSNLAECWMSIRAKFDGGKQINRVQRGAWNARSMGAGLRFNYGPNWSPRVWSDILKIKPDPIFERIYEQKLIRHNKMIAYSRCPTTVNRRKQWKYKKDKASKEGGQTYGPNSSQVEPDLLRQDLQTVMKNFYSTKVCYSKAKIKCIAEKTVGQDNSIWHAERRLRVTASNIGTIVKRRKNTNPCRLVHQLLYRSRFVTEHTDYGKKEESRSISDYETLKCNEGLTVKKEGIIVSHTYPYLAGSPDGIVLNKDGEEVGIIEIKNLSKYRNYDILSALQKAKVDKSTFPLVVAKDGHMKLKKNHDHYYQCMGLLLVTGKNWVDYVLRSQVDIYIERLLPDYACFEKIIEKSSYFYGKAILPELAHPRLKLGGIRKDFVDFDINSLLITGN